MPTDPITLRPKVQWFAEQMELRLRANDWKGGWQNDTDTSLYGRTVEEVHELGAALFPTWKQKQPEIIKEAADVANFAMMLADNAHRIWRLRIATGHTTEEPTDA